MKFISCVTFLLQLMDGRKTCGGRLEFKVRVRDPFVSKQVEEVKEKWVVIDHFDQNLKPQVLGLISLISSCVKKKQMCLL